MHAVVIGGSGFIGAAVTKCLLAHGDEVLVMDLAEAEESADEARFKQLDVRTDTIEIPPKADIVFCLAQSPDYRNTSDSHEGLFLVNTWGALRAYYAAVRAGAAGFVFASTGNVYAPSFRPLGEDAAVRRDQPYALSKLVVEEWLAAAAAEIPSICVRLFGVFGPNQKTMLPWILRSRVQHGEPITLDRHPLDPTDVDGLRVSFSYVGDVVEILRQLAVRIIQGACVPARLNVAGPEAISLRKYGEVLGGHLQRTPVFQVTDRERPYDLIADISRLRSLGEMSFTPFEQAIARCVE